MSQTEASKFPRDAAGRCKLVRHAPLRRVAMTDRYFVDPPISGAGARLEGSEAHHLTHVMRAKPGDLVTLFDGSGAEFAARVECVGRADVELAIVTRSQVDRELPVTLVLGVALPKGDRGRWLVEKATELGATRLVPLVSDRSGDHQSAAGLGKLRRAVIEASKQCGRNCLMKIEQPQPLAEFVAAMPPEHLRLIAQPGATPLPSVLSEMSRDQSSNPGGTAGQASRGTCQGMAIAVGPEGGFTSAEIEAARSAGWQAVGLGRRTLRIETAALALAAALAIHVDAPAPDNETRR